MTYMWRCRESGANPSPPNSLLNREKTGNFRRISLQIADLYGLSDWAIKLFCQIP